METECCYDFVQVFDGDNIHSPFLASFSGSSSGKIQDKLLPDNVMAKSGMVIIILICFLYIND